MIGARPENYDKEDHDHVQEDSNGNIHTEISDSWTLFRPLVELLCWTNMNWLPGKSSVGVFD